MNLREDRKIQRPTRRELLLLFPFALCYAFFIVLGDWQRSADYGNVQNMGRLALWTVISWGILLLLCFLLENSGVLAAGLTENIILSADVKRILHRPVMKVCGRRRDWRVWLFFFGLCLFSYLPYYLMYYPTWFNNDAIWQMEQALGMAAKSNHHPYFHTLIVKLFLTVGNFLFGSLTAAVAFYTFFQVALTAAVFGLLLLFLYERGTGIFWLILAGCFYALLPVNALLSICMGKDAWFTAAFLLFTLAVFVCLRSETVVREKKPVHDENTEGEESAAQEEGVRGATDRGQWIFFGVTGLSVCLLRSNGIFVFLGTAAILIVSSLWRERASRRENGKAGQDVAQREDGEAARDAGKRCEDGEAVPGVAKWLRQPLHLSTAAVLILYFLWQGPVLSALHVEPPDTIEGLTMPTQHLLCAYKRGGSLTAEEIAMLERVVPLAEIDAYYNPYLFDMTKNYIRENGHQEVIAENKGAYAKLWFTVGLKNPMLYLEAQIRQTAGYYALHIPHETYLYGDYFMVDNPFGIETERKLFTYDDSLAMGRFLQGFQTFYRRVWSLGANTWLLLFALACALYRKRRIAAFLPALCLLGSLMLATPVYNEFRYAYGVFAALPVLVGVGAGREKEA